VPLEEADAEKPPKSLVENEQLVRLCFWRSGGVS
jgi:hypothetical protein